MFNLGWPEMTVIAVLALLIFGRRLPEVGRSLGKGIVEFKKGLREVEDDVKTSGPSSSPTPSDKSLPANKEQTNHPA